MANKQLEPPIAKRSFASPWGELDYLCKKTRFWLYAKAQKNRAERYVSRLKRVLDALPDNEMAILRQEGLALLYELQGDVDQAIVHRKREIQLMERLIGSVQSAQYSAETMKYVLRDRDTIALRQRRALLNALQNSKLQQSHRVLRKAR